MNWLEELIERLLKSGKKRLVKAAEDRVKDVFKDKVSEPIIEGLRESDADDEQVRAAGKFFDKLGNKLGDTVETSLRDLLDGKSVIEHLEPFPDSLIRDFGDAPKRPANMADIDVDWGRPSPSLDQDILDILRGEELDPSKLGFEWKLLKVDGSLDNGDRFRLELELSGERFLDQDFRWSGEEGRWRAELDFRYEHFFDRDRDPAVLRFDAWTQLDRDEDEWGFSLGAEWRF